MNKAVLEAGRQGLVVIRRMWCGFPEGRLKERLRKLGLRFFFKRFPIELTLRKGETIVQVGAIREGQTLTMALIVGENGRVIAIEPEKANLEALRQKLEEKSVKNVTLVPKGAWSEKGKRRLFLSPHSADHKIEVPGVLHDNDLRPENYQSFTEIEVDTVDNILRDLEISSVDYAKITVNGAELEVLKGMEETLRGDVRLWVKGHALKDGQPINKAIASFLEERGFFVQIGKRRGAVISKDFIREGDVYATRSRGKIPQEAT